MAKKKAANKKTKAKKKISALDLQSNAFDERQYRIDNAADILLRAEKLKTDKPLMKEAKKELTKRAKAAVKAAKGD